MPVTAIEVANGEWTAAGAGESAGYHGGAESLRRACLENALASHYSRTGRDVAVVRRDVRYLEQVTVL